VYKKSAYFFKVELLQYAPARYKFTVRAARKARVRLLESRDQQVRALETGDNFRLHCRTSGRPTPKVTWFKDGDLLTEHSDRVVQQSGLVLIISYILLYCLIAAIIIIIIIIKFV